MKSHSDISDTCVSEADLISRIFELHANWVIDAVCQTYAIPRAILLSPTRGTAASAHARHVVSYILNVYFEHSLTAIGAFFGRHRTSIGHGVTLIEDKRDDPCFEAVLEQLNGYIAGRLIQANSE